MKDIRRSYFDAFERGVMDFPDDMDSALDEVGELQDKILKILCDKVYKNHFVIDDHCGREDHRVCLYCRASTPNQELSE